MANKNNDLPPPVPPPAAPADVSSAAVLGKLKEWKEWIVMLFGVAAGVVVAWNSKANTSDLAEVRKLQSDQGQQLATIAGQMKLLDALHADLVSLRDRFDRTTDPGPKTAPTASATVPAKP
jgi:hypothetical protein